MSESELRLHLAADEHEGIPTTRITLHQAPCGCVGILLGQAMLVLSACDGDDRTYGFFLRQIDDALASKPLSIADTEATVRGVQSLLGDGYRYRDIRSLLRLNEP